VNRAGWRVVWWGVPFFAVATVWMTRPLAWRAAAETTDLCDQLLSTWIWSWELHALATDPARLFHANSFFPMRHALALTEHMLGHLPLFAPVALASGNPLLGTNLVLLVSFALTGLSMTWLVWYYTRRLDAALAAGFLFTFAPARLGQITHVQLAGLAGLPLAVYFVERLLDDGGPATWIGFVVATLWQSLVSYYLAFLSAAVLGLYGATLFWRRRRRVGWIRPLALGAGLAVVALAMVPMTRPYLILQRRGVIPNYANPELHAEPVASADPIRTYLSVANPPNSIYGELATPSASMQYEKTLFPGFFPLVIVGAWLWLRGRRLGDSERALLVTLAGMYVLSLGPWLTWNDHQTSVPLPAYALARWVPGYGGIRAWTRFGAGFMFALAGLFGVALAGLTRRRLLVAAAAMLVAIEYNAAPIPLYGAPAFRTPGWEWLHTHGDRQPLLAMPIDHVHYCGHTIPMYRSIGSFMPIVNGYGGHSPVHTRWGPMFGAATRLPASDAIDEVRRYGLRWILLDERTERPDTAAAFADAAHAGALRVVARFGPETVYEIPR